MRTYRFVQVDVFSAKALEGNPLAIFPDARGLSDDQMQAIARETNLSETTFVFPRDPATEKEKGVRVRIFTVVEELPFAGHPTLGTAWFLQQQHGGDRIELDLNVGKIPVSFRTDERQLVFGEMRQRDPEFGKVHDLEEIARATGLAAADIDSQFPIQTVSTGVPFTILPIRKLSVMQKLRLDMAGATEYLEKTGGKFFYIVCHETVDPQAQLHARMLFYNGEDPATGSAAGCATGWAVMHGVIGSDQQALIEQGVEMKRPSRIYITGTKSGDRVVNVRVGGHVVEVMRGEALLP